MSQNLLTNPSLEADTGTPPAGWTVTPVGGASAAAQADPFAFDQDNDLIMSAPSAAALVTVSQTTAVNSFQEGEHAHVSFAVRPRSVRNHGEVTVQIVWLEADGTTVAGTEVLLVIDECSMFGSDWRTYRNVSDAAPILTSRARLEIILDGMTNCTGDVLADLVVLSNEGAA